MTSELAAELGLDDSELDIKKPKQVRGPYAVRIEVSAHVAEAALEADLVRGYARQIAGKVPPLNVRVKYVGRHGAPSK